MRANATDRASMYVCVCMYVKVKVYVYINICNRGFGSASCRLHNFRTPPLFTNLPIGLMSRFRVRTHRCLRYVNCCESCGLTEEVVVSVCVCVAAD